MTADRRHGGDRPAGAVPGEGWARCWVRLTPRGGRDSIDGVDADGVLHVRVRAAPVDGAANAGLVRFLAASLDVPQRHVVLEAGTTQRRKRLALATAAADRLEQRVPGVRLDRLGK